MQTLKLTGQEQYILLQALQNFDEKVSKTEFPKNSIFTKEFVQNHITTLTKKIERLQEQLEPA